MNVFYNLKAFIMLVHLLDDYINCYKDKDTMYLTAGREK